MKTELRDIREITDSREMLEARPHAFVSGFVYILLAIILAATIWASIGEIDVHFKALGTVRPGNQIVTVRNAIAGRVKTVNCEEGMVVKAGDVLFSLEIESLQLEEQLLLQHRQETDLMLANLDRLSESVAYEQNCFDDTDPRQVDHATIYQKYETDRKVALEQIQSRGQDISYSIKENGISINALRQQIALKTKEQENYELLKQSVQAKKNLFASEGSEFSNRYLDYTYRESQLQDKIRKLDAACDRLESIVGVDSSTAVAVRDAARAVELADLELIKFDSDAATMAVYYQRILDQRKLEYDAVVALKASGGATDLQVSQALERVQAAELDLARHTADTTASRGVIQKKIQHLRDALASAQLRNAIGGSEAAEQDQLEIELASAKTELARFRNEYLISLDSAIEQGRLKLIDLDVSMARAQAATDAALNQLTTNTTTVLDKLRLDTSVSIYDKQVAYRDRLRTLDDKLKAIAVQMQEATVLAPIDGTVNVINEIAPGELLGSGLDVATIVPDTETDYKIVLRVSNKDVSGVEPGQIVKYHFLALPFKEYGELVGTIRHVAVDSTIDRATGLSYYSVEASVDSRPLYSYKGEQAEIKVGMVCEAQIITESKKIIHWLLEKLDLIP